MTRLTRRSLWTLGCLVPTAVGLLAVTGLFAYLIVAHRRHARWYRDVEERILRLAEKQPAGVNPDDWAFCTFWTWQLHDNHGGYEGFDHGAREPFLREFDRRLEGPVDLHTIDWIWDQYVEHNKGARSFSRDFRPTDPRRLREFAEGRLGEIDTRWWAPALDRRRTERAAGERGGEAGRLAPGEASFPGEGPGRLNRPEPGRSQAFPGSPQGFPRSVLVIFMDSSSQRVSNGTPGGADERPDHEGRTILTNGIPHRGRPWIEGSS